MRCPSATPAAQCVQSDAVDCDSADAVFQSKLKFHKGRLEKEGSGKAAPVLRNAFRNEGPVPPCRAPGAGEVARAVEAALGLEGHLHPPGRAWQPLSTVSWPQRGSDTRQGPAPLTENRQGPGAHRARVTGKSIPKGGGS